MSLTRSVNVDVVENGFIVKLFDKEHLTAIGTYVAPTEVVACDIARELLTGERVPGGKDG